MNLFLLLLLFLTSQLPASTKSDYQLNRYVFKVDQNAKRIKVTRNGKTLWETPDDGDFLEAGVVDVTITDSRAHFYFEEEFIKRCRVETMTVSQSHTHLVIEGDLSLVDGQGACGSYIMSFYVDSDDLSFTITSSHSRHNYVKLRSKSHKNEAFYGFGVQPTHINLKGHALPILTQEQGIGRGSYYGLFSLILGALGYDGSPYHSYIAAPHFITSDLKSMFLKNNEYSFFDMTSEDKLEILVHGRQMEGNILYGHSPLDLISAYTKYSGRMKPLPDWVNEGAIVGLQGGNEKVERIISQLLQEGAPIAAVWLQDWVGKRETIVGKQLWWNWDVDAKQYDWQRMQRFLKKHKFKLMGYINPMLVDVPFGNEGAQSPRSNKSYYNDFKKFGLFVRKFHDDGGVYHVKNTDFEAGLLDLTNPQARKSIKNIIKQQLIGNGMSGWMADYGEALPFDARLMDGSDAKVYHNIYPVEWAKINSEAIAEAGREADTIFFNRSGFSQSPGVSKLFWLGDQTVTWDKFDGFHSSVIGLMGGGFSGFSLNHSDIGGYATASMFGIVRKEELFLRWMEANAFTAVFRTHEGNQPEENIQLDGGPRVQKSFAKFSRIYKALTPYRKELYREAFEKGYPLVRHPFMHYPQDKIFHNLDTQFMLGGSLMVVPTFKKGDVETKVVLPRGRWIHLWSGDCYDVVNNRVLQVESKLGFPAVFLRNHATLLSSLKNFLPEKGKDHSFFAKCGKISN